NRADDLEPNGTSLTPRHPAPPVVDDLAASFCLDVVTALAALLLHGLDEGTLVGFGRRVGDIRHCVKGRGLCVTLLDYAIGDADDCRRIQTTAQFGPCRAHRTQPSPDGFSHQAPERCFVLL